MSRTHRWPEDSVSEKNVLTFHSQDLVAVTNVDSEMKVKSTCIQNLHYNQTAGTQTSSRDQYLQKTVVKPKSPKFILSSLVLTLTFTFSFNLPSFSIISSS